MNKHLKIINKLTLAALFSVTACFGMDENAATTNLRSAVVAGRYGDVVNLLGGNINVNAVTDRENMTALHWAARGYDARIIEQLLRAGADVNAVTTTGWTALHNAAREGRDEIVALLLMANAVVDAANNAGRTALHMASWQGHSKIVALLLRAGAHVDGLDDADRTALREAVAYRESAMIEQLLQAGANREKVNKSGELPMHKAAGEHARREAHIIDQLLETYTEEYNE
jgi:ankyrin repeat protein